MPVLLFIHVALGSAIERLAVGAGGNRVDNQDQSEIDTCLSCAKKLQLTCSVSDGLLVPIPILLVRVLGYKSFPFCDQ